MRKHVGQLRAKKLGKPRLVAGFTEADQQNGKVNWLGVMYGLAFSIRRVESKTEASVDLVLEGHFAGDSESGAKWFSELCWLPDAARREVVTAVKTLTEGNAVAFAYKVGSRHAANDAGYEYVTEVIKPVKLTDPMTLVGVNDAANAGNTGKSKRR